jgi:acetolactate synthase-1/2/3 large subunit
VHVDLPYDVMLTEAGEDAFVSPPVKQRFLASIGDASAGIAALVDAIEAAQRPAIIVGQQVSRRGAGAEDAFLGLVEKLGAPVFATVGAKGTLEEQHPLFAGTFRGAASERPLLDQADLILLAGFDAVEIFTPGVWHYKAAVVSIDEAPYTEGPYQLALEVIANLEDGLRALAMAISSRARWNREDVEAYRQAREPALHPDGSGLMPGAVIRIARERLAADGFMSVDAGQHKVLACDLWETRRRRGFLSSSGLGTMAVAIPAAMAAKLLDPAAPSLCLVGDGGFLMRAGDLETAVREDLPIVIVVFNDRTLNLIKLQQDRRGVQRLGTSFADCDFAAVARGFGFEAERVDSEAGLDSALQRAFASGRPYLIDALVNPEGYV